MSKKAGQIRDLKEAFIGEYIYLRREDQAWLDAFCKSWLSTYENDSRFFLTIDLETTGLDFYTGNILLISVSSGQHAIVFRPQEFNMELFREVLNTIPLNNHNIKFDLKWLYFHLKVDPVVCWDTMLAAQVGYAGNFPQKSFALDNVVGQLLDYSISKEVRQAFIGRAVDDEFTDEEVEYSARDAILTHLLVFNQKKRLKNTGLLKLFETVEIPLVTILARSEYEGVRVDLVRLQELFDEKESDLDEIYQNIQTLYQSLPNKPTLPKGVYNPGSPKQIVDVLASQGIRVLNTEEITLAETRKKYPNCDILGETIRYRELKSEISKYLKSWLKKYIHPVTGKIHPNFKPCGTTTGRLACAEPNMQNITGDYRTMIIPAEGWSIISQDYCYDDQTEVLTDCGWKLFRNLDKSEKFYSMDPETNQPEYISAKSYSDTLYCGHMLRVRGQSVDLLTTPNHRHFVNSHWNKDRRFWEFKTSIEIAESSSHLSMKRNALPYPGLILSQYEIHTDVGSFTVPTNDFLRVVGYYLADGSWKERDWIQFFDRDLTKLEAYNELLFQCFGYWGRINKNKTCWTLCFKHAQLTHFCKSLGHSGSKKIPNQFWSLDHQHLRHLLLGLMEGDGTQKRVNNQYTTTSKDLANDVQRLLICVGLGGSISTVNRGFRTFPNGKTSPVRTEYYISVSATKLEPKLRHSRQNALSWEFYAGHIYCVELQKHHLLMVRRNGKHVWSGNSQFEFRACAGLTQEPSLIKSFEDRSKLLPQIKPLAASYGYIDVDNFVKDIKKKKLQVRPKEEILVDSFAETDIHVRNAALILGKLPKDVDYLTERSVGKCVSLDTLVHLEGKAVTVESLLPKKRKRDTYYELKGVKVLTDTGYCTSPQIYYSGSAPAVRVTTQGGRTIVCAPHHRFRSVDKRDHYAWVQARDLTLGADIWVKPTPISYDSCISEEESLQAQLWAYYITQVRCEEGKLVGPAAAIEKCAELQKKLRFNGRPVKNGISSPALVKWLGETCGETELFPSSLLEASPAQRRVFLTTIVSLCGKHHLEFREGVNLRKMQNLLSLCGLNSWKVPNGLNLFREELEKFLSEDVVETNRGYRSRFPDSLIEKTFMSDTKEQTLALLSKKEKELCDFLAIHNLRKDRVLSIEAVGKVEMADLVVPENSTVVYEGLVTHNTIGYALLYGAGPGRIQDTLVKDGFQVTLEECREFHDTFLRKMTRVADLIRRTHKRVVEPRDILDDEGEPIPRDEPIFFVETILGRKRFFSLPYVKYDREWMKEKAKAEREAVNFLFQGANADATKKAMVLMDEVFHEFPDDERPRILLSVHDEIVTHCPDQHIAKVSEMVERIMVETGSEAINWAVPIEVSRTVGKTWSK